MRKIIRKLFNKLGYDFVKINVHSADKAGRRVPVKVGNYNIVMPGNNPQISVYKQYPGFNTALGRLAKLVAAKYTNAAMIDVGANVGDTIAIIRSHTNIPVIGVEGDATSLAFLKENTAQFENIDILNQYLGEEEKEISVSIDKGGWNNTIIPDNKSDKKLNLQTLDHALEHNNLHTRSIKLLKIDTEGFDTIILRGSRKIMANDQPVLYFEYNGENMKAIGEDGLGTLLSLKQYGYSSIHFYDCVNNLILATTLDQKDLLTNLDHYTTRNKSMVPYYDICVFHTNDQDLSDQFYAMEN